MIYTSHGIKLKKLEVLKTCGRALVKFAIASRMDKVKWLTIFLIKWEYERRIIKIRNKPNFAPGGIKDIRKGLNLDYGYVDEYPIIERRPKENQSPGKLPPLNQS